MPFWTFRPSILMHALAASIAVTVTGCALSTEQIAAFKTIEAESYNRFVQKVVPIVKFDPYSNMIHFDRSLVNQYFAQYSSEVKVKAAEHDISLVSSFRHYDFKTFFHGSIYPYLDPDFSGIDTVVNAADYSSFAEHGWMIGRAGFTHDNKQFGEYEVPVVIFTGMMAFGARGNMAPDVSRRSFHKFSIKQRHEQPAPVAAPPAPAQPAQQQLDPSERLRKLKSLLDDDLINEEEFRERKEQILKDL